MRNYYLPDDYIANPPYDDGGRQSGSFWTQKRIRTSCRYQYDVYRLARGIADSLQASTVVDLGCGAGKKLNLFFEETFRIVGVDSPEAVTLCRKLHARGEYYVDDLERPSLRLKELVPIIDLILCADVIEHLAQPDHLLRYARDLASAQTRIVLSTPCRERLLGARARSPSIPEHCREWASWEFRRFVESCGFHVVEQLTQRPFRFRPDWMTVDYLIKRAIRRMPLMTTEVIVCTKA